MGLSLRGGVDGYLDVLTEKQEEAHEPLEGESGQAATQEHGDLWLVDSQEFGGPGLGELAFLNEHRDLVGQFGLGERLFGVGNAEVGEDISAADDVIRFVFGHGSGLPFPVDFDGSPEPLLDQFDFALRRCDSLFCLLLKGVEDVDRVLKPDGVDGAEGIAAMVGDNFKNSAFEALERLGIWVLVAHLRLVEGEANVALHRVGEFGESAVRVANEEQVFHLAVSLSHEYARFGMIGQEKVD